MVPVVATPLAVAFESGGDQNCYCAADACATTEAAWDGIGQYVPIAGSAGAGIYCEPSPSGHSTALHGWIARTARMDYDTLSFEILSTRKPMCL